MSYAIIRNQNHKIGNVPLAERHNERHNNHYSNTDIDISRSQLNYHLKEPTGSYLDTFYKIREKEKLKGNLRVNGSKQSTILCEFIITSDKEFFDNLGEERTHQFFKDAYRFVCHKAGGEQYIVSATVHMDETTPHMHCSFIPVVSGKDRKGQPCKRINCSEFWKGRDSYSRLQDEFYEWVTSHGYDLERGNKGSTAEHLSTESFKLKKVQEQFRDITEKTDEAKKMLEKDVEMHSALKRQAKHYYNKSNAAKEEAKKLKEKIELDKAEFEKMMIERTEEFERNLEAINRIQAEYEKVLSDIQETISTIKDEAGRNALEKRVEESIRKRAELTAELNEYVDYITRQRKNKDRGFSL